VATGTDKSYSVMFFVDMPDQEPVMFYVTFPVVLPLSRKAMGSIARIQALFVDQLFHYRF